MLYIPSKMIDISEILEKSKNGRYIQNGARLSAVLTTDEANAPGLYIFSLKVGRGVTPWYVGKAVKQSLRQEIATADKVLKFNSILMTKSGTPYLTLIPRRTKSRSSLSKPGNHKEIDLVETMLIARCLEKNENLINIQKTAIYENLTIHGMLNSPRGKPSLEVCDFKALIGL